MQAASSALGYRTIVLPKHKPPLWRPGCSEVVGASSVFSSRARSRTPTSFVERNNHGERRSLPGTPVPSELAVIGRRIQGRRRLAMRSTLQQDREVVLDVLNTIAVFRAATPSRPARWCTAGHGGRMMSCCEGRASHYVGCDVKAAQGAQPQSATMQAMSAQADVSKARRFPPCPRPSPRNQAMTCKQCATSV